MSAHPALESPVPLRRLSQSLSPRKRLIDFAIALVLFCLVFTLYALTTTPGVLDGDQGEYQFMPAVLGIPHPSGFPLYVLLGHLWSGLPIGSLAYRMNLFSGLWGALTVAALFLILRWQNVHLVAALAASATLAVIPQFWQYSTVAAVYRLHNFLIVLVFGFLAQWERTSEDRWLHRAALAFGLDLANHLTIVFFAPFTALLLILVAGRRLYKEPRLILSSAAWLLLPLLLYLYFPLRAAQLASPALLPGWPENVARGLVSPFYPDNASGLWAYFVGGSFYSTVTGHWQWTPDKLVSGFVTTILQSVNWQLALVAILGIIWLSMRRPRLVIWLTGSALLLLLLAVQYSVLGLDAIGQFSSYAREYYLPAFIMLVILAAWGLDGVLRAGFMLANSALPNSVRGSTRDKSAFNRFRQQDPFIAPTSWRGVAATVAVTIIICVFMGVTIADLISHRSDALTQRSAEIEAKWQEIKAYPPEVGSILIGHWGDLTPLWYYQYAEGWRPDLLTIHPPDEERVKQALATSKSLYLAGALLNWAPGITQYNLMPWGPLVRVSQKNFSPASPLKQTADIIFQGEHPVLHLLSYETDRATASVGDSIEVNAFWRAFDTTALDDYVVSLSLVGDETATQRQTFPPVVNWLPGGQLKSGQYALSNYRYTIPWGTPPGSYHLRMDVYSLKEARNLDIVTEGEKVEQREFAAIQVKPPLAYPDSAPSDHSEGVNLGGRVQLLGYNGDLNQVTTGDSPTIELLWKSTGRSQSDLSVDFYLENAGERPKIGSGSLNAKYPSERWLTGEIVRGVQTLVIPADLPEGVYELKAEVRDGTQPLLVAGQDYSMFHMEWVHVVERAHNYTLPAIQHSQTASWDGRVSML
ncbi:MAG: DUF2723 domain-containing protein, partial [Anaerolineae bacterium]